MIYWQISFEKYVPTIQLEYCKKGSIFKALICLIGACVWRPGVSRAWSFSTLRSRNGSICQGKPASDQTQDTRKPYTDPAQDTRKPYTDPAQETRKPGGEEHNTLSNRYYRTINFSPCSCNNLIIYYSFLLLAYRWLELYNIISKIYFLDIFGNENPKTLKLKL